MKRNKGQGLVEYMLILVFVAIVIIVILVLFGLAVNRQPCDKSEPTAGDIVSCIATRTAEAKNR